MIMLLTVALVMGAIMVAMAAPAFASGALFLASDQGSTLQVTPQTTTQGTITKTISHPTSSKGYSPKSVFSLLHRSLGRTA